MTHRFGCTVAALAILASSALAIDTGLVRYGTPRPNNAGAPATDDAGGLRGATCGPLVLSQLTSPNLAEDGAGVACPAPNDNFWARCYDLSVGPLAGQPIIVNCVDFGVEANARTNYSVTINLYLDSNGCPPEAIGMGAPIASQTVLVPDGAANVVLTATFGAPVNIPANSRVVVELFAPGAGQTAGFFIGGNNNGQTGPSYIKSAPCGIAEYVDIVTVNAGQFADSMWLLNLGYGCASAASCCFDNGTCQSLTAPACIAADGIPGACGSTCTPGLCPVVPTGACCHDGICDVRSLRSCDNLGGRWKGAGTTCTPGQCSGACCTGATCADNVAMENCDAAGQRYKGDGTTCAGSGGCSGGCCDGTTCTNGIAPEACPGRYLGDGVACAPAGPASASCAPPAVPTISEWGLIILGALVLGAGAIAVSRRKASA